MPKSWSDSPNSHATSGTNPIAAVPSTVTAVTAVATSSSSPSATVFTAATADAPQIDTPVASSRDRAGPR
jgi:hypothetical protein